MRHEEAAAAVQRAEKPGSGLHFSAAEDGAGLQAMRLLSPPGSCQQVCATGDPPQLCSEMSGEGAFTRRAPREAFPTSPWLHRGLRRGRVWELVLAPASREECAK